MFVMHNPHSFDMLFKPLSYFFVKKRAHLKYQHLIKSLFGEGPVNVVFDYSESSLLPSRRFIKLPYFLRFLIIIVEIFFWKRINKCYKMKSISRKKISDYVLISFSYKSAVHLTNEKVDLFKFSKGNCFHLSHYMIQTKNKSKLINRFKKKSVVMADVDLTKNEYYKKFFSPELKLFIVPFQVSKRFKNIKEYDSRSNKILISGTVHDLSVEKPDYYYEDFINFFNINSYHMIRSFFVENKHKNVDSYVSLFRCNSNTLQKEYFKIDLVELLNNYKYVCYDRELSGAPAITTFEAISCGCIPIVQKRSLDGLELERKFTYVEFEDNIEDFKDFLDNRYEKLNGENLVQKNLYISEHMDNITKNSLKKIRWHFLNDTKK